MDILQINLGWLILTVFTINFLGILLMRSEDRFWLPCVITWLFLFFFLVIGNVFNSGDVRYQQTVLSEKVLNAEEKGQEETRLALQQATESQQAFSRTMLHLLGFQSLLSLFWTIIGYKSTGQRFYQSSMITFFVFCLLYIFITWVPW
jgi:hypothetical protein